MKFRLPNQLKAYLKRRIDVKLPLPKNKFGEKLSRDGHIFPKYVRDSYRELKKVVWPSRRETWRLFMAVTAFAIILATVIAIADYFFEKIIERLFL